MGFLAGESMKINKKELLHYIIGAILLILAWIPLMELTGDNIYLTSIAWFLWYITIDQILHVVIKKEKISIIKVKWT